MKISKNFIFIVGRNVVANLDDRRFSAAVVFLCIFVLFFSLSRRRAARLRGYVNDYYSNSCTAYAKDDVNGNVQSTHVTNGSPEATNFWLVYFSPFSFTVARKITGPIPLILVRSRRELPRARPLKQRDIINTQAR